MHTSDDNDTFITGKPLYLRFAWDNGSPRQPMDIFSLKVETEPSKLLLNAEPDWLNQLTISFSEGDHRIEELLDVITRFRFEGVAMQNGIWEAHDACFSGHYSLNGRRYAVWSGLFRFTDPLRLPSIE